MGITHLQSYLYGSTVRVVTDYSAVKSVLETPDPTRKHARWWTRVYGSGVKAVDILYRSGQDNVGAGALSRNPCHPPLVVGIAKGEVKVATIATEDMSALLQVDPVIVEQSDYSMQENKDPI